MKDYVGEIIESSLIKATAQSKELHVAPPFGSFVKIEDDKLPVFGVVFDIATLSLEPNRQTVAYGIPYEQLKAQQPQIFSLLKTNFDIAIIGYKDNKKIYQNIPPHHPKIHSRVFECEKEELNQLTSQFDFIRTLLNTTGNISTELISACLRGCVKIAKDKRAFLIKAGKELSNVFRDDYSTLQTIIKKAEI